MADNTDQAIAIAAAAADLSNRVMRCIDDAHSLNARVAESGITLANFNSSFVGIPGIKQLDGTLIGSVLTSFSALETWATTNFHTTNWQSARS
jgi:hypothetical protein